MTSSSLDNTSTAGSAAVAASASSGLMNSFLFNLLFRIGKVGTGLIAIVAGLLYAKQESLLYFPEINGIPRRPSSNPRSYRSPSEYNIPFSSHKITCSDNVSIHAWLLLHESSSTDSTAPTIMFFHGNAGNIGLRLPNAAQMYHNLGCNIFMVEYRGYGDSDDVKPNEKGLKLDAESAYQFLLSSSEVTIDTDKIFVFGRSLGGAVAFHLARYAETHLQKPLRGIIVENTFRSISKMVDTLMPLIAPLKFLVLRMDWNSEWIAPMIQTPILYLAGDKDELVPHSHMKELYNKSLLKSVYPKIHIIKGGTHNDSWIIGGKDYFVAFKSFMSHVILHHKNTCSDTGVGSRSGVSGDSSSSRSMYHNSASSFDIDHERSSSVSVSGPGSASKSEVTMGGDKVDKTKQISGAIPIMPKNILTMAKEVTKKSFTASDTVSDKKKEI